MRRIAPRREMGEAISIEDALSLLTVVFVLFVLFFVPLVNIDRMKLEQAKGDAYWDHLSSYLDTAGMKDPSTPYGPAFAFDGDRILASKSDSGRVYVEHKSVDGDLVVVEHQTFQNRFIALYVKGRSTVSSWRYGSIRWSAPERVWFTTGDTTDYAGGPEATAMRDRYRSWSMSTRGF